MVIRVPLNLLEERIWFIGIEDFVTVHHGNQIFRIAQIDDIVRIARKHVDGLNLVTTHLPLQHLAFRVIEVALLNQSVAFHHNKLLELGVVPVLALSDAGLADVDAHLTCFEGMN